MSPARVDGSCRGGQAGPARKRSRRTCPRLPPACSCGGQSSRARAHRAVTGRLSSCGTSCGRHTQALGRTPLSLPDPCRAAIVPHTGAAAASPAFPEQTAGASAVVWLGWPPHHPQRVRLRCSCPGAEDDMRRGSIRPASPVHLAPFLSQSTLPHPAQPAACRFIPYAMPAAARSMAAGRRPSRRRTSAVISGARYRYSGE